MFDQRYGLNRALHHVYIISVLYHENIARVTVLSKKRFGDEASFEYGDKHLRN